MVAGAAQALATGGARRGRDLQDPCIHSGLGDHTLYCEGKPPLLFIENDTNNERVFRTPNATPYVKDAINNYVVAGRLEAVKPNRTGTKAAAHYQVNVAASGRAVIRPRLSNGTIAEPFGNQFDQIINQRRREADAFYQAKPMPGCCGASSISFSTPINGSKSTAPIRCIGRPASYATANGSTWSATTSFRCRTNGNTRGLRPGISPFTRSRCRWSTSISPSNNSTCCSIRSISIRPVRSRL